MYLGIDLIRVRGKHNAATQLPPLDDVSGEPLHGEEVSGAQVPRGAPSTLALLV